MEAYNNRAAVRAISYENNIFRRGGLQDGIRAVQWGLATTLDVIDADTTLISAQRSLMNARYDFELADLQLKYSTGTLLDDVLKMHAGRPERDKTGSFQGHKE